MNLLSKNLLLVFAMGVGLLLDIPLMAQSEDAPSSQPIPWISGPNTGELAEWATLTVPAGFSFTGQNGASRVMELTGNLPSGTEVGVIIPDSSSWFVVFSFDACGYVADDEKADLDANEMLKSMKEHSIESNKERVRRGMDELFIVGWKLPPYYDSSTHNLQWAFTVRDTSNLLSVNFNTRLLGRDGVMEVMLAADPDSLDVIKPVLASLLSGFSFKTGRAYSEFRDGDKMAEYGLTALVVGGGAAVAAKSGLFKYLWKLIIVVVAGGSAFVKKLFSRRRDETKLPPGLGERKDSNG